MTNEIRNMLEDLFATGWTEIFNDRELARKVFRAARDYNGGQREITGGIVRDFGDVIYWIKAAPPFCDGEF